MSYIETIEKLADDIDHVTDDGSNQLLPLKNLISTINEKFDEFGDDRVMNLYYAAKWCYDNMKVQQGYTFLQENIITLVCWMNHLPDDEYSIRDLVNSALTIYQKKLPESEWDVEDVDQTKQIIRSVKPHGGTIKKYYGLLTEARNNINHAGMNQNTFKPKTLKDNLGKSLEGFKPFFEI